MAIAGSDRLDKDHRVLRSRQVAHPFRTNSVLALYVHDLFSRTNSEFTFIFQNNTIRSQIIATCMSGISYIQVINGTKGIYRPPGDVWMKFEYV